jgi:predicted nucleic acid-binding Zn ribbon protein
VVWRPLPLDNFTNDPRPVSASLGRLAASLGAPRPDVLGAVFSRWEQVVGSNVAAHARPLSLRDGLLVISVDHPAWATELSYLRADLLRRLEEAAGPGQVLHIDVRVAGPSRSRRARSSP